MRNLPDIAKVVVEHLRPQSKSIAIYRAMHEEYHPDYDDEGEDYGGAAYYWQLWRVYSKNAMSNEVTITKIDDGGNIQSKEKVLDAHALYVDYLGYFMLPRETNQVFPMIALYKNHKTFDFEVYGDPDNTFGSKPAYTMRGPGRNGDNGTLFMAMLDV
jgi:hypothetical protein